MAQDRQWTRKEVKDASVGGEVYFVIHNHVYSVRKFMDEHPGGHEVLVAAAGGDASEQFDDVSHSLDAKEMMKQFSVGQVVEAERSEVKKASGSWDGKEYKQEQSFASSWKLPVLLGVLATVIYSYLFG